MPCAVPNSGAGGEQRRQVLHARQPEDRDAEQQQRRQDDPAAAEAVGGAGADQSGEDRGAGVGGEEVAHPPEADAW